MPAPETLSRNATARPRTFQAGTLTYSPAGLASVFVWLLAGDFIFILINQIQPVLLPVILKQHGATDREIALLISSIPAAINLFVNPIVSYASDRTQSRWGRRIPYLALATPFVTLFLALTPFAPEIAHHTFGNVVLTFGLVIGLYQLFQTVDGSIYFYLLRDVVPLDVMGRFLSLMRIFSALGLFTLNYWLLGYAETRAHEIFIGVAIANLVGFGAMCLFVREGKYPAIVDTVQAKDGWRRFGAVRAVVNFAVESFRHPIYRWTYLARLLIYASWPMSSFIVLFAHNDLGLPLDVAGRYMAWPAFAWLLLAYPAGRIMDRCGPIPVMRFALLVSALGYVGSFFLIGGPKTFLVWTLVTGVAFWIAMLAQTMLSLVIFHPTRIGQLSGANTVVQSIVIAAITGPASGLLVAAASHTHVRYSLPGLAEVDLSHYRFIYLLLAAVYFVSLVALTQVRRHWLKLGGATQYQPPL